MKSYFIVLGLVFLFAAFTNTSTQKTLPKTEPKKVYNLDSLKAENKKITKSIKIDTDIFKQDIINIEQKTKTFIKQADKLLLEKQDTVITVDTTTIEVPKKKGWFKKVVDKIKKNDK